MDLSSYLLEPMQRITRYPLLLKQIVHYTPKTHPDQPDLLSSLLLTEALLTKVNMAAREAESRSQLIELNRVISWAPASRDVIARGAELDLMSATRMVGARVLLYD